MTISKEDYERLLGRVKDKATPMLDRAMNTAQGSGTTRGPLDLQPSPLIIDLDPIGAPRQSRRDAWKPSARVLRYRAWKDKFRPACEAGGWTLGASFRAEFEIAMPKSWPKKKRASMVGTLHQQKFDIDNLVKACLDAFGTDDSHVASLSVVKRWSEKGRIILHYT